MEAREELRHTVRTETHFFFVVLPLYTITVAFKLKQSKCD